MLKNKMKLFLLFSIVLISLVGAAYAAEIDDTSIQSDLSDDDISDVSAVGDNNIINNDNNEKIVAKDYSSPKTDNQPKTMTELNQDISEFDELELTGDYVKTSSDEIISINKTIVIDGKGFTIDADLNSGLFIIGADADVTFKNITIKNNFGSNSPFVNYGNLTFLNVIFENNKAEYEPAIVDNLNGSNLYIINSSVNDSSSVGGVFELNSSKASIIDSNFTNCHTSNGVLRIYSIGNATVSNSRFINNTITTYGAAISTQGYLVVNSSYFEGNVANVRGGAIALRGKDAIIANSTFISNRVERENPTYDHAGGAISVDTVYALIYNNTMINNSAYGGDDIYLRSGKLDGIKISMSDVIAIEDEEFTVEVNVTDDNGNKVSGKTVLLAFNSRSYEGNVINGVGLVVVSDSIEPGNYTAVAIYNSGSEDEISCEANIEIKPNGLQNYAAINSLISSTTDGILVLEDGVKRSSIEDSINIRKNLTLDGNGFSINANIGHIFNIKGGVNVTIKNFVIYNTYGREGLIANITGSNVTFENVTVRNNEAYNFAFTSPGNLFYVDENSNLTINNSVIENNTAAIIRTYGKTVIDNTSIKNTQMPYDTDRNNKGWIILEGQLEIRNSYIENNSAQLSGIYGQGQKLPSLLINSTFINNSANTGNGGVMHCGKDVYVLNCTFINNRVTGGMGRDGGVLYNYGGNVTVISSIFLDNYASGNGSAIANYYGSVNIEDSIIIGPKNISSLYNEDETGRTITANNNWWGTNDNPKKYVKSGTYWSYDDWDDDVTQETAAEIVLDTWIYMNSTATPTTDLTFGDKIEITTSFNQIVNAAGEVSEYNYTIPDGLVLTYESETGFFDVENVEIVDGIAKNNFTIKSGSFKAYVKQDEAENIINGTATMPEALEIILNDGNYTEYFKADGSLKDFITPNSILKFDSTFKNRDMYINLPVTMTTYTNQAIFENCTIVFGYDAAYTNISDIIMNNKDSTETVMVLEETHDITIKNISINQYNFEDSTHAIQLIRTHNINILFNNITVVGPCEDIDFATNKGVITSAIVVNQSINNTIEGNNILTNFTGNSSEFGTVESIEISGNSTVTVQNNKVINNNITTQAGQYAYGVVISNNAKYNLIDSNNITSYATYYSNAIEVMQDATYNNITNNNLNAIADTVSYAIYVSTNYAGPVTNNLIAYNNITANSSSIYLIELWSAKNNTVIYNNFTANNNYALGIGAFNSTANNISYNNMDLTGDMAVSPVDLDNILVETTGIKLCGSSNNNYIVYNNISVKNPTPLSNTMNTTGSRNNTITNNYLITQYKKGDASIINDSRNIIHDNLPDVTEVTVSLDDITAFINQPTIIKAIVTDGTGNINGGKIYFIDGDSNILAIIDVTEGEASFENTFTEALNTTITAIFEGGDSYNNANATATLTVRKAKTTITINEFNATIGQPCNITATVVDENGNTVNNGKVTFKVDGKVLKDSNGKVIYAKVTDGLATIENYEIPESWSSKNHTIMATYSGNSNYESSKVENVPINITESSPVFKIEPISENITLGLQVTIKATVTGLGEALNNGKVVFKVNGKTLKDSNGKVAYVKVVNGTATLDYAFDGLKANEYTLSAVFIHSNCDRLEDSINITIVE